MLLQQATVRNVSRALREIKAFEGEGDYKPMTSYLPALGIDTAIVTGTTTSGYEHATMLVSAV